MEKISRKRSNAIIPVESIQQMIFIVRGQKVMLSPDLASLYDVEPRALIQAVKRNIRRFPDDFMFQLSRIEAKNLKSQIVISSWGGRRANPYAFTEQGVAMLSSVLKSERAIVVNIMIMRAFVKLREILLTHKDLARKMAQLESRITGHDDAIRNLIDAIRQLMAPPTPRQKRQIGFERQGNQ
jgi:hypothetical protein